MINNSRVLSTYLWNIFLSVEDLEQNDKIHFYS